MENLQESQIHSVSIIGRIPLENDRAGACEQVLSKHQSSWPRRSIDKLGLYEIDGIRHHLGLDIELDRGSSPRAASFSLEAHSFSSGERLRAPTLNRQIQQFAEISAILSDLEDSQTVGRFHSHVAWMFPPDSRKTIVSLPMITIQDDASPFDEIVGIRLSKATEAGNISITMDLRSDRSLFVTVIFPLPRRILSGSIVSDATKRGNELVRDFVFDPDISVGDSEAKL